MLPLLSLETGLVLKKVGGHQPRRELINGITVFFYNVGPHGEGMEAIGRGPENAGAWLDEAAQMPAKTQNLANATLRQKRRDGTFYPYQALYTTTPRG